MGEAKRRQAATIRGTVYHHTSTLRTNLIWMNGVIDVEGRSGTGLRGLVFHPQLGEIKTDANLRRSFNDFPRLAWFTSRIAIPQVLIKGRFLLQKKDTGGIIDLGVMPELMSHGMTLNRMALGFPVADVPIIRWQDHPGYSTGEGQELNESAHEAGDDPRDWWVSEVPVDVMAANEVWIASSITNPKLVRNPTYLQHVKQMVAMCREREDAYIPPSWLTMDEAKQVAGALFPAASQFVPGTNNRIG